jgi:hypothetical protein
MEMSFNRQFGGKKYTFTVAGNNLFELVMQAQKISSFDVFKCGMCESEHLYLYAYTTEKGNFDYVKLVCADCKAQVTFGQPKKDKNTFYLRKNEDKSIAWEKYEKKNRETTDED